MNGHRSSDSSNVGGGLTLMLSAQNCYGRTVVAGDGKKIGVVVNVILNKINAEATFLVFPPLGEEAKIDRGSKVARSAASVGGRIVSSAIRYVPGLEVAGEAVDEITSMGTDETYRKAQKKLDEVSKTYYFIPTNTVKQEEGGAIALSITSNECEDWFRNVTPSTESEYAFFDYTYYQGPSRMTAINVNLQAIRGKTMQDAAGGAARIIDVKFDSSKGCVTEIDVLSGQGRKSVAMQTVKLDYNAISCDAKFEECPAA